MTHHTRKALMLALTIAAVLAMVALPTLFLLRLGIVSMLVAASLYVMALSFYGLSYRSSHWSLEWWRGKEDDYYTRGWTAEDRRRFDRMTRDHEDGERISEFVRTGK